MITHIGVAFRSCSAYTSVMATTKKSSTSKTAKSTRKVSTPRKNVAAKKTAAKVQTVRSFRVSKPETPFLTFTLTRQTAYWLVLGFIVILFALWITKLQADIQGIYDTIDMNTAAENVYIPAKKQ